jgi:hypothetical protein
MSESFHCPHCQTRYQSSVEHFSKCSKTDSTVEDLVSLTGLHFKQRVASISDANQKKIESDMMDLGRDLQIHVKRIVTEKDRKITELETANSKLEMEKNDLASLLEAEKQVTESCDSSIKKISDECALIIGNKRKREEDKEREEPAKKAKASSTV